MPITFKETFFLAGSSDECILLIHGLTASPAVFEYLAQALHQEGYSIKAPLLPGHGTKPEDLIGVTWENWLTTINHTLNELKSQFRQVHIIGVSLGGNLALTAAADHTKITGKIISIGTPIRLKQEMKIRALLPIYSRMGDFRPKPYAEDEKDYFEKYGIYPVWPYYSLRQLLRGIKATKKNINRVVSPVMAIQADEDSIVDPTSGQYILKNVKAPKNQVKELVIVGGSHVPIIGKKKETVINEIIPFLSA